MKKINFFLPNFHAGGAERVCINLANDLSTRHLVTLYVNENVGPMKYELGNNIDVRELRYRKAFANILQIRKILQSNVDAYNVVFLTHQILVVLIASTGLDLNRMIVSERNHLINDLAGLPIFKRYIFKKLIRIFYPKADKIICVSDGVLSSVAKVCGFRDNLMTIYNPVIGNSTHRLSEENLPVYVENIVNGRKVILTVGRLEDQKNHKLLINAFAKFYAEFSDAVLLIAGEGSRKKQLENQIKQLKLGKSVYLLGYIENPFPLFSRADCFVLSSNFEGLPGVLIQALAYSKNVIATDCESGPREILKDGTLGQLVKTGDELGLKNAMMKVFKNQVNSVKFTDRDLERFEIAENIKKYEEIITQ